ncbi:uncharacterized protein LOC132943137 [Metopolophium dirhodum]|uniref:uncharacterized protein LOC132943137 n=1 Tax=Metopolophium dirhodum TaxID=44670 RepID=UPI00298F666B|nr:uncharacterized protein LOC132943137 [Metopolophium dirhodum]
MQLIVCTAVDKIEKKSLWNKKITLIFIGELFRNGAFPEKVILSCITDLSKENNDNNELKMHCLCTILQLVGPILSKTNDLNKPVNKLVSSINDHGMSSTLKCLIHQVKRMHSKGWKNEEPVKFVANNHTEFSALPTHMKSVYTLKSDMIMAEWEVIQLLKISNIWNFYDPVLFVVSTILVALEENKDVRNHAGKLLDSLNRKTKLSACSIQSGVNKVLNDLGTKKDYPNLSNLVSDITGQFLHCCSSRRNSKCKESGWKTFR